MRNNTKSIGGPSDAPLKEWNGGPNELMRGPGMLLVSKNAAACWGPFSLVVLIVRGPPAVAAINCCGCCCVFRWLFMGPLLVEKCLSVGFLTQGGPLSRSPWCLRL